MVVGSNPTSGSIFLLYGQISEWPNEADCKSASFAFGGSNPSLPTTILKNRNHLHAGMVELVDTSVLEAGALQRESSSLSSGTIYPIYLYIFVSYFGEQIKTKWIMKTGIHPDAKKVNITCSCGEEFHVKSTIDWDLKVEICSACHPFYTGEQKILKTGAVDKFYARMKKTETLKK